MRREAGERIGERGVVGREEERERGSARFLFFRELSWSPPAGGAGSGHHAKCTKLKLEFSSGKRWRPWCKELHWRRGARAGESSKLDLLTKKVRRWRDGW